MYFRRGHGCAIAIFFRFSLVVTQLFCCFWWLDATSICELSRIHRRSPKVIAKLYDDMTEFSELQKVVKRIAELSTSMPDHIVYHNKKILSNELAQLSLRLPHLSSYGLRFLDEISMVFHLRNKMASDSLIRERFEPLWRRLMFSILQEAAYPSDLGFTFEDLLNCEKTNPLALHTIDVIGKQKFDWTERFISALKHHSRLQKLLELASSLVAVEPSVHCSRQLMNLISGCDSRNAVVSLSSSPPENHLTSVGYTTDGTESSPKAICPHYCVNVIRGCLAPALLLLPVQALNADPSFKVAVNFFPPPTNLWQWFLSSSPDRPGTRYVESVLDVVWTSLNVTTLVESLKQGLQLARNELSMRRANFYLLCRDGVMIQDHPSHSVVPNEVGTAETQSVPNRDELLEESERIRRQMQTISEQLIEFATKRMDVQSLVESAERRFCSSTSQEVTPPLEAKHCWNGNTFGNYDNPIVPFTVHAQQSNPEVSLTRLDLYSIRPGQQLAVETVQSQTEPPQADWDQNAAESSGFRPILEDIGFIPPFVQAGVQTVSPINPSRAQAAEGCSPDDEDCIAEFGVLVHAGTEDKRLSSGTTRTAVMKEVVASDEVQQSKRIRPSSEVLPTQIEQTTLSPVAGARHSQKGQSDHLSPKIYLLILFPLFLNLIHCLSLS